MAQKWATCELANGQTQTAVTTPTTTPRVAAPRMKPRVCSIEVRGGVRKSPDSPIILACRIEDEELAKALLRMVIMTRPGATNWTNGMPCTGGRAPLVATEKINI